MHLLDTLKNIITSCVNCLIHQFNNYLIFLFFIDHKAELCGYLIF